MVSTFNSAFRRRWSLKANRVHYRVDGGAKVRAHAHITRYSYYALTQHDKKPSKGDKPAPYDFRTESPTIKVVFEIISPKHIGVTTLAFQGHVTSSIT